MKDIGLVFTAILDDGSYCRFEFDSVERLRREWYSDDPDVPPNDAPIADCELRGVPIYVDSFIDIIELLGVEHGKE